jgi:hypothetical protein
VHDSQALARGLGNNPKSDRFDKTKHIIALVRVLIFFSFFLGTSSDKPC